MLHTNYILLDAARMGNTIEDAKQLNKQFDSLYRGRSEESLAVVAPYIFSFASQSEFGKWYFEKGWGDAWGIMIQSSYPMNELHRHFRKFLIVGTEDKQELYFRFYDPRVLRIFLPTCNTEQLKEFFGPIDYFVMESDNPEFAIKVWLENYELKSMQVSKEVFMQSSSNSVPVYNKPVAPTKQQDENRQEDVVVTKPTAFPKPTPKAVEPNISKPSPAKKEDSNPPKKSGDNQWNKFFFD